MEVVLITNPEVSVYLEKSGSSSPLGYPAKCTLKLFFLFYAQTLDGFEDRWLSQFGNPAIASLIVIYRHPYLAQGLGFGEFQDLDGGTSSNIPSSRYTRINRIALRHTVPLTRDFLAGITNRYYFFIASRFGSSITYAAESLGSQIARPAPTSLG
ncbi:hypothetical protein PGT21_031985 [Puccinia graminis f. sp. tritici]|uniref:Uncharacterized protein n=1 Tax=Puccinia graminis f. sp. tritici TaxID=56615 RepID=A0A5B0QU93_PUCGR|nr:hypothetical protein PGT21_031985 [Puccinia graminis f. sp. tritici]KAA1116769.1 hypothetical protein PGTUg99_016015 [Puccinia graminis f. sp. tritici]